MLVGPRFHKMADREEAKFQSTRKKLTRDNAIESVTIHDIRFPTSKEAHGSDAMHKDPDYSAAYVVLKATGLPYEGHGISFTLGRGTEIVVAAAKSLVPLVQGWSLLDIYCDFASFWRHLTCETQLRWIGPEKGAIHLAVAGIVNALWDLWGKIEGMPVWKLLSSLTPSEITSLIDFTYITDVLTPVEAEAILKAKVEERSDRESWLRENGYTAYTTSVGWLGYSDDKIRTLAKAALTDGFRNFKVKVGQDVSDDTRRCAIIRDQIGWDNKLMMDANQRWEVSEAVEWMEKLVEYKPFWIEEPTSPDDVLGHLEISQRLEKHGIGVATGEHCQNRVVFKQFLKTGALQFCQIDSARVGGVNENLAIVLMAAKFGVPVCPHGGGVGLCEMVQHLSFFDFICVSGTTENRMIEYVDHLHEHFISPVVVEGGCYKLPESPGYSSEMKPASIIEYSYPDGPAWQ